MTRTSDDALLLDRQLCFLVYRLHRGITDLYRPVLAELGLTYPQYLVMLVLWEADGVPVSGIGDRLALDSGTLSPLIKRLEAAGLVERHRDAADERVVLVSLTAAGRALRRRARAVPMAVAGPLAAGDDDPVALHRMLSGLVARVDAATA